MGEPCRTKPSHITAGTTCLQKSRNIDDLSPLLQQHQGIETKPIIDSAGQDITHWFDADTADLRKRTADDTLIQLAYTPLGSVLHVPPSEPRSDWRNDFGTPWWKDKSLW